jgi:hypothetical protein
MHINQPVPPLPQHIPQVVQNIVYRALEKEPSRRFSSASEMMQYCQQALGQLGGGGVASQSPGVPTAPATPSPLAARPGYGAPPPGYGAPPPGPPPGYGAPQGGPARTMLADGMSPFAQGGHSPQMPPPMGMGGPPPMGMGGPPPMSGPPPMASPPPMSGSPYGGGGMQPQARTVLADGMAQLAVQAAAAGRPHMQMQPPMQPQMQNPPGGPHMHGGGGGVDSSPRTMMLEDSEGVVSFAKKGKQPKATPAVRGSGPTPPARSVSELPVRSGGASPLFWIVCLITGLAIGLLAYLAVLKLGK